jgi:hypothetical protein
MLFYHPYSKIYILDKLYQKNHGKDILEDKNKEMIKNNTIITIEDYEKELINKIINIITEILKIIPTLITIELNSNNITESQKKITLFNKLITILNNNPYTWINIIENNINNKKKYNIDSSISLLKKIIININVLSVIFQRNINLNHSPSSTHISTLIDQIDKAFNDETLILNG